MCDQATHVGKLAHISMRVTLSVFLGIPESEIHLDRFTTYQNHYDRTWKALWQGNPAEIDHMSSLDHEHVRNVVKSVSKVAREGSPCRDALRDLLARDSQFQLHTTESLNSTIDLALPLWLVLNIRDEEFAPGTDSIQWTDEIPLQTFVAAQFPIPRLLRDLSEKMFDSMLPGILLR